MMFPIIQPTGSYLCSLLIISNVISLINGSIILFLLRNEKVIFGLYSFVLAVIIIFAMWCLFITFQYNKFKNMSFIRSI